MNAKPSILVVEDEADMLRGLQRELAREGYDVETAATGTEAARRLDERVFDVVITDLKLPGLGGIEVLKRLKESNPESVGIVITGYGTIESAVDAMRAGAYDFISKPFELGKLKLLVRNALRQSTLASELTYFRRRVATEWEVEKAVATSPAMRSVLQKAEQVAPTDSTVLLLGESGTGKELVARRIHHMGPRREKLFTAVNCAMLREALLESELFGHVKGAFTGAVSSKRGLLETAHGGTFFLDEVAEVSGPVQAKLLRVLEERSFMRLGSTETVRVDIRLIAATNRDLSESVSNGSFRGDLYYRLNVFPIYIPPLRERREDIPLLAYHFLRIHGRKLGKHLKEISPGAMGILTAYDWPGNVRELANAIERGTILATGDVLGEGDISHLGPPGSRPGEVAPAMTYRDAKRGVLFRFDRQFVGQLLDRNGGNVTRAAAEAGMDRANFQKIMRRVGVTSGQGAGRTRVDPDAGT